MLRWGVLGAGWIAERFVASLRAHTDQQVVAVGSRSTASAERFAAVAPPPTGPPRRWWHPVDVVYVATPHQAHRSGALLAIAAGKHVDDVPAALRRRPAAARGWRARRGPDGAGHGEAFEEPHRILDPAQAGGALLDLGGYTTGRAPLGARTGTTATIVGTAATLTLPGPFFMPGDVALTSADDQTTRSWTDPGPTGHDAPFPLRGRDRAADRAGRDETPLRTNGHAVAALRLLDTVTAELGLDYSAAC